MTTIASATYHPDLTALDQWVCWRYETVNDKLTKIPYNARTGGKASSTSPNTWVSFDRANHEKLKYDGIGFVFSETDDFTGIDLDHCRDAASGRIDDWAQQILDDVGGYAEESPSGSGIHIWVRGHIKGDRKVGSLNGHKIEMYDRGRFFTVTGQPIGTIRTIDNRQAALVNLYRVIFEPVTTNGHTNGKILEWTASPSEGPDDKLLTAARSAKNGAKFSALYDRGDTSGHNNDDSHADLALCSLLAYWTDGDTSRVDRLFRQSALYRSKWDEKRGATTYGALTIAKSLNGQTTHIQSPRVSGESTAAIASGLALTDFGNAERLVARHGADLRYCHAWKTWLNWRETHWDRDESNQVERYAKATVRAIYDEASRTDDPVDRKAISRHAVKSEAEARIKAMMSLASSEKTIPVEPSKLDADPWLLNVANGTIDLRTGELRAHQRSDLITRISPIIYDPDARLPLWEQFLLDTTDSHAELIAFLQRAVGYSLTGSTQEEKLFFVHGPSRAGKSTFLDAVKTILGTYGMTADFESFLSHNESSGPRQDIARLAGARFVVSIEVDEGKRLAEGLVKMITGGDSITARFLYGREFEYIPAFKLWLAANSTPKARTDDDAIWNRIIRIPFNQVVPPEKRDPKVKLALRDPQIAGPALLAWAVKGCLAWQRDGLRIPDEVKASSDGYRLEVDKLAGFIDDCCVLDPEGFTWSGVLLEEYERWAKANNERRLLRGKAFAERLRARGCTLERREKGNLGFARGWAGITMQEADSDL